MPTTFIETPTASFITGYRWVIDTLVIHTRNRDGSRAAYSYIVPESVALAFHNAPSKGRFLNTELRGKFPSTAEYFGLDA